MRYEIICFTSFALARCSTLAATFPNEQRIQTWLIQTCLGATVLLRRGQQLYSVLGYRVLPKYCRVYRNVFNKYNIYTFVQRSILDLFYRAHHNTNAIDNLWKYVVSVGALVAAFLTAYSRYFAELWLSSSNLAPLY